MRYVKIILKSISINIILCTLNVSYTSPSNNFLNRTQYNLANHKKDKNAKIKDKYKEIVNQYSPCIKNGEINILKLQKDEKENNLTALDKLQYNVASLIKNQDENMSSEDKKQANKIKKKIQYGAINILKLAVFTNKDQNTKPKRTNFNIISQDKSDIPEEKHENYIFTNISGKEETEAQIYTKYGMSNVNLTGGPSRTNDMTSKQDYEVSKLKESIIPGIKPKHITKQQCDINVECNHSQECNTCHCNSKLLPDRKKVLLESVKNEFVDNKDKFIDDTNIKNNTALKLPNSNTITRNSLDDKELLDNKKISLRSNYFNSDELLQNNKMEVITIDFPENIYEGNNTEQQIQKQVFNNINIDENYKLTVANNDALVKNSELQKNSKLTIDTNNNYIELNNIDAYDNVTIVNNSSDKTFTMSGVNAKGPGVVIDHSQDNRADDTIIIKDNNNQEILRSNNNNINNQDSNHPNVDNVLYSIQEEEYDQESEGNNNKQADKNSSILLRNNNNAEQNNKFGGNRNIISVENINSENEQKTILRADPNNNNSKHKITCQIKSGNNKFFLDTDKFDETIFPNVELNTSGSDNYNNLKVHYIKRENFSNGKVILVNNQSIQTNNYTYRFITHRTDLYLVRVTERNKQYIEYAIHSNGGRVDDNTLKIILDYSEDNINNGGSGGSGDGDDNGNGDGGNGNGGNGNGGNGNGGNGNGGNGDGDNGNGDNGNGGNGDGDNGNGSNGNGGNGDGDNGNNNIINNDNNADIDILIDYDLTHGNYDINGNGGNGDGNCGNGNGGNGGSGGNNNGGNGDGNGSNGNGGNGGSGENNNGNNNEWKKKNELKKKMAKIIMQDPASALATYCADLEHKEQTNKNLMSELFDVTFDNKFMYSLLPIQDIDTSKKKYWIRGNITGLNSDKYNTNSVLIGGDIFSKLFSQSLLKLQLLGGTMFGKIENNSNDYNTLEFLIGPKLSLLHKYFIFEILGLYRYDNVGYSRNNKNEFTSNIFSFGSKFGFNINLANKFVVHPYIHALVSNILTSNPVKLSNKYQVNWAPGLAIGYKVSSSVYITADYKYHFKPVFVNDRGVDVMNDPNKKGSNEFGLGFNTSCDNSVEISLKGAVDVSKNQNKNSNKEHKCDVKIQAQVAKSF